MNYSHIVWDWNGTLFNDASLCCDISNSVLLELGNPQITFEFFQANLCHPMVHFYRKIVPHASDEEWSHFSHRFHELYAERRFECALHNSAETVLQHFDSKGHTQSILSAHPQDFLEFIVGHFNLRSYFSTLFGALDRLAQSKVERGIALLEESSHSVESTLVIGDTDHDAEVAKEIGAKCILIANGFQSRAVLERCGVPVFDTLEELAEELIESA